MARTEGVILDPVYSGKAMAGLIDQVRSGRIGRGESVVFVHTGGTPALFAYAAGSGPRSDELGRHRRRCGCRGRRAGGTAERGSRAPRAAARGGTGLSLGRARPRRCAAPTRSTSSCPSTIQAQYMWPSLMASRTKRQAPRLLWRGRGVGGSTAINGQIAIRGVLSAFDQWAELGCEGWSGPARAALLQPARGRPRLRRPALSTAGAGRSRSIALRWSNGGRSTWRLRDAALDLGYPWADDLNAPDADGVCCYAINSRDGVRVSTNDGYLEPARGRPNLEIRGESLVDKVLLDGRTGHRRARPHAAASGRSSVRRAGGPGGRRLPLPADPAALGHRPGRASAGTWHRGGRGSAGRRRRLRPSLCPHRAQAAGRSCGPPTSTRATPTAASSTAPASPAAATPTC